MKVAVGHSTDPDSYAAIADVLAQCTQGLAGAVPQAGILLAAIDFEHARILYEIDQAFPGIELVGGTTDGELSSVLGFQQDSLTLMLFSSDTVEMRAGLGRALSKDLQAATQQAVAQASAGFTQPIKLCLTTPESLTVNAVTLLEELQQALGPVPIFGGLTADQWRFQQTYQFYKTEVVSDAIPILLMAGDLQIACGVASGWQPIGQPGTVTKAVGTVIQEIDGKPALDFYHRYLGGLAPSSEYPLAVFDSSQENFYLRAPIGTYDPETGTIDFFGNIPEQAIVQITEATRTDILEAARCSLQQALESYSGKTPSLALFFSCASRRQLLGMQTALEYQEVQDCLSQALPDSVLPSCGFYSNGEIAPFRPTSETQYHNETFITLILGTC